MNVKTEKKFPDVSFYQGNINWDIMRSKTDAVIIRAGQGKWIDSKFNVNYNESKKRGMYRGIYWFYDDRVSPGEQANLLIGLIKNDPPEMEVWIDWERTYNGQFKDLKNIVAMMEVVEKAGFKVGMYTGYYWFLENTNTEAHKPQLDYLKTKPLWLAWYVNNPENNFMYVTRQDKTNIIEKIIAIISKILVKLIRREKPTVINYVSIPRPWTSIFLWQYGTPNVGKEYGTETIELDMNYINMTNEEFYKFYKKEESTEEEEEKPMEKYKLTVIIPALNIRNGVGTSNQVIGTLKLNDIIISRQKFSLPDGSIWFKIDEIIRNGFSLPVPINGHASSGVNYNYMRLDETTQIIEKPTKTLELTVELEGYKPVTVELEPL